MNFVNNFRNFEFLLRININPTCIYLVGRGGPGWAVLGHVRPGRSGWTLSVFSRDARNEQKWLTESSSSGLGFSFPCTIHTVQGTPKARRQNTHSFHTFSVHVSNILSIFVRFFTLFVCKKSVRKAHEKWKKNVRWVRALSLYNSLSALFSPHVWRRFIGIPT